MKIIVIGYTDYKEKDIIVNAISEEGPISFKVRGALNPNSAFIWLKNPLVTAEVGYVENVRYRHQILKEAKLISSPLSNNLSLEKMENIGFVMEIINNMFPESERHLLFHEIEKFLKATKETSVEYDHLAQLIFLAKAIKAVGSELVTDRCVHCGATSDIVAFSFSQGGFVCRSCLPKGELTDLYPREMKLVISVFRTETYENLPLEKVSQESIKILFIKFNEYINEGIGVHLGTVDNIIKSI